MEVQFLGNEGAVSALTTSGLLSINSRRTKDPRMNYVKSPRLLHSAPKSMVFGRTFFSKSMVFGL